MSKQVSSLCLRTIDLPTAQTNVGVRDSANTTFLWSNINLRVILGDMWDKYDYFNIIPVEIASSTSSSLVTVANNSVNVVMTGLPWLNNGYFQPAGVNSNKVTIATYQFVNSAITNKMFSGYNKFTFSKTQEQCNISIYYEVINDGTLASTKAGTVYPAMTFTFMIEGAYFDDNINVEQRIFKK